MENTTIESIKQKFTYYKERASKLRSEADECEAKANAFAVVLGDLSSNIQSINDTNSTPNAYGLLSFTLKDRVLEVFEKEKRLLKRTDIISVLHSYYKEKDEAALQTQISSILSNFKTEGKLKGVGSKKSMIWGMPYMFEDNGQPKPEFMQ